VNSSENGCPVLGPRLARGQGGVLTPGDSDLECMRKNSILILALLFCVSCSPQDFLTRRLAADLISASPTFKAPQKFLIQTGIVSSKEYPSPEFLVLQQHGWMNASNSSCPAGIAPPPCWELNLTPSGVDAVRTLISPDDASKPSFSISVARHELIGIDRISKQDNEADVDFTWRWAPLNEIGAALYSSGEHYQSSVGFRKYDDGWHVIESEPQHDQMLDDALKNAEPTQ
jgi:hypothetical protein